MDTVIESVQGTYPVYDSLELLSQLEGVQCPIDLDTLDNPTCGKVKQVYAWWLDLIFPGKLRAVEAAVHEQLERVGDPEGRVYGDAFYCSIFAQTFSCITSGCKAAQFRHSDLTAPRAEQFQDVLCALLNYFYHSETLVYKILTPWKKLEAENTRKIDMLETEIAKRRQRNEKMRAELEVAAHEIERDTPALEAKRLQFSLDCVEAHKLRLEAEENERIQRSLKAQAGKICSELSQHDSAISKFRSQLCTSPDRLVSEVVELKSQLARQRQSHREVEAEARQLGKTVMNVSDYSSKLEGSIGLLQEGSLDQEILQRSQAELSLGYGELAALGTKHVELSKQVEPKKTRNQAARHELAQLSDNFRTQRHSNEVREQQLKRDLSAPLARVQDVEREAAARNAEAEELEREIFKLREYAKAEREEFRDVYRKARKNCLDRVSRTVTPAAEKASVLSRE